MNDSFIVSTASLRFKNLHSQYAFKGMNEIEKTKLNHLHQCSKQTICVWHSQISIHE